MMGCLFTLGLEVLLPQCAPGAERQECMRCEGLEQLNVM